MTILEKILGLYIGNLFKISSADITTTTI